MTTLLICLGAVATLALMSYLAASAGAKRWRLLAIEFDGEAVYECARCGKRIGRPL